MKPYHRLGFVVPVLMLAGTLYSIWAYHERGISGLRVSVEGWLIALITAVLLNLFLRRFRENADQDSGEKVIGWTIFAAGTVVGAYAFGLARGIIGITLTAGAVLTTLFAIRSATRPKKTDGTVTR